MTAFGAPSVGEVLAERYELEEHINDDSVGRQVWRGVDIILRRPVAVVLRYPGGDSAMEMLQAAVTASRVVHPNLVGVYDAIDEGERAYVVREWVEGAALREIVASGPLDAERATTIAHAVAAAVAAVHATGMAHGNVHPGTVLIDHDGRVVLADARADGTASAIGDVRAVGGVLYFALTGHWPQAEAGRTALPDAVRDSSGALASPRQSRAGVPDYLDKLTMDLLDPQVEPPTAELLAAELGRLDSAADERFLDDSGPLRFSGETRPEPPRPTGRKIVMGIAAIAAVSLVVLLVLVPLLTGGSDETPQATGAQATGSPTAAPSTGGGADNPAQKLAVSGDQVRIVDPKGDRTELKDAALVVDGDTNTGWKTQHYRGNPKFGGIKPGMGVLIDLGSERHVVAVKVELSAAGASAELRTGTTDPGSTRAGDQQILSRYTTVGEPITDGGTTMAFGGFDPDKTYRYLLLWITSMPKDETGEYQIGVQEIEVNGS
ncbi:MAG: protein kinase family protein [Micromonosporaceae bacterium]|nr:protein kinase family protein [Micromonosporaceae bacterium]